jgi:hypothetical protein
VDGYRSGTKEFAGGTRMTLSTLEDDGRAQTWKPHLTAYSFLLVWVAQFHGNARIGGRTFRGTVLVLGTGLDLHKAS